MARAHARAVRREALLIAWLAPAAVGHVPPRSSRRTARVSRNPTNHGRRRWRSIVRVSWNTSATQVWTRNPT